MTSNSLVNFLGDLSGCLDDSYPHLEDLLFCKILHTVYNCSLSTSFWKINVLFLIWFFLILPFRNPKTNSTVAKCGQYEGNPNIFTLYFAATLFVSSVRWIDALSNNRVIPALKFRKLVSMYIWRRYKNTQKSWDVTVSSTRTHI